MRHFPYLRRVVPKYEPGLKDDIRRAGEKTANVPRPSTVLRDFGPLLRSSIQVNKIRRMHASAKLLVPLPWI